MDGQRNGHASPDTLTLRKGRSSDNSDRLGGDQQQQPTSPGRPLSPGKRHRLSQDEVEAAIAELPDWRHQLSLRGLVVGSAMGLVFAVITLKLGLGSAGIVPGLNIPAGLLSFAVLKGWTAAGGRLGLGGSSRLGRALFHPFGLQENAVLQTFITAVSNVAFTGGFGTYLTGMDYQAHLNLGGPPRGSPGFSEESVYDPQLARVVPYMLMTSVLGVFMLIQLRKVFICDWRLPFPSGTASGLMLTSFHTKTGESEALRKVRLLGWTSAASFLFSLLKWLVQGADYACGFGSWPSFGFRALKYTWNFDWQLNYVGGGMICPHIVNWSMLLGAVLSWGLMWPLVEKREGDWYPAGLKSRDFKGLFGYKVFLTISVLMGEGVYMMLRALASSGRDGWRRYRESQSLPQTSGSSHAALRRSKSSDGGGLAGPNLPPPPASSAAAWDALMVADSGAGHQPHSVPLAEGHLAEEEEEGEGEGGKRHLLEFKESSNDRRLRTAVFLREQIPWWLAPVGYGGLAALSTAFIPLIYRPVRWYHVLVAYAVAPLFAIPNAYGTGLTDWDNCSMYAKLALFIFASWAGASGNGIIVGLGICGVVFGATSSAAVLMQDFRTGYICLTAPRAMFVAQLLGQVLGAVLAPVAFMAFFYSTGQVNVPDGLYPAPFSTIYRGMALIGTEGFGALPKHCGQLMLAFFLGGILLCVARDLLPRRYARFVPSPMAMGIPFYIGASSAINFWLGSVVMHIWEAISREGSCEFGPTVGAGLLVGDGLFSIPTAALALKGVSPPWCMGFYGRPACRLPYCVGFWAGGSDRVPAA